VDNDGDMDALSASLGDHRVRWYEINASQTFTARAVSQYDQGVYSVIAADIDGDGDTDAIAPSYAQNQIIWYENDGQQSFTRRVISTTPSPRSIFAADMDGDGNMDILSASPDGDRIAWHQNNGSQVFTTRSISAAIDEPTVVMAADMDGDGDMDALSVSSRYGTTVNWYENNGSQAFTRRTIDLAADHSGAVIPTDIDNDDDVDVLVPMRNKVVWYENNGTQIFTPRIIISTETFAYHWDLFVADMDGDGDLDVLSGSQVDGKVAWYRNLNFDFGDAPAPYPATLAENGARHEFGGPQLGSTRDQERDGVHPAAVGGDHEDDDGVRYCSIRVGQLDATVTVNVQNAPAGARLDAWIDFDGDGSWGGALEQIANNLYLTNGNHTLNFDVPSWAADGETFARFRLSTDGNLGVRGIAADGEVEDHAVTIAPPAATSGIFSGENTISSAADGPLGIYAADMDRDGDMDLLSASFEDSKVVWYENDGSQNYTPRTVSNHFGANSVLAVDMNADGDMDIVTGSFYDDQIILYENNGAQMFISRPVGTADGVWSLFAADVDADGDTDVLSASRNDSTIAWFSNSGSQTFAKRIISADISNGAYSVFAADVDGDGDMDVLSASSNDGKIRWHENDGSQGFTARTVSAAAVSAQSVFAADVDGDGDTDVLSASRGDDKIAWYENDGNQNFTLRIISTTADLARSVFAADLDGDGDTDVLAASSGDDKVTWYENDGSQNFTARTISDGTTPDGASRVFAADVDSDGDLDVLSASNRGDRIAWYENVGSRSLVGDLNSDARVDCTDVAIFTQNFGTSTGAAASQGDLNGDGNVGLQDLAILQSNLDAVGPSPPVAAAPAAVSVSAVSTSRVAASLAANRRRVDRDTAVDRVMTSQEALSVAPVGPRILRARRNTVIDRSASAPWQ
jgi:hypothetical protein